MNRTLSPRRRSGFTLVELLVVMTLMVILAALAVGVAYSGAIGSQKVVSGSDRASGWLLISKQRAQRDGAPRGVRFYINPPTTVLPENRGMVTEAQYIEQPDAWVPNRDQETNATFNVPPALLVGARIVFVNTVNAAGQINGREVHFIGSPTDLNEFKQRVFVGDQLVLPELGDPLRIIGITSPPSPLASVQLGNPAITYPSFRLELLGFTPLGSNPASFVRDMHMGAMNIPPPAMPGTSPNFGTYVTYKFAFQPAPQPLLGEPTLQLTGGTVIDYRTPVGIAGYPASPVPVTNEGYRDWSNPTPPGPAVNPPPYNPSTTIGVTLDSTRQYFDILFSQSGQVMNAPSGLICLWVRDSAKLINLNNNPRLDLTGNCDSLTQYNASGQQILVVVYTKTGAISTQQVAPPPPAPTLNPIYDPYSFAKDGINAGL